MQTQWVMKREQDEGAMAGAVLETRVTDITWDLEDPYLEFTNENSSKFRPQWLP